MISERQITEIGRFGAPHGIKGELNAVIDSDIDINALKCIIADIDGIYVPFFITSTRSKGSHAMLISVEDIGNETEALLLQNKTIYALADEVVREEEEEDENSDGFYAEDLIGFDVVFSGYETSGKIIDVDDSTDNILFIIRKPDGTEVMVPVTDEFIDSIDPGNNTLTLSLPSGFPGL